MNGDVADTRGHGNDLQREPCRPNGRRIDARCVALAQAEGLLRSLILERRQGQLFQAVRIAFAALRELDHLLGHHVS